ncbi:DUF2218 domain-containing protein [Bailinhaonella thermotolerans]|uniref:DUF2218 domain-containing protein n=1 Tax=Bailinhaonella thermotolerans TaxID=1070861 RepID=A0A3A4B311_9ACTN|nr:DUF2218 domain-containing protein [Bailinhaonella thermotolerans]RJL32439.1 DUF2218 domain-containing protein [Bailinhaonella thermotolerans]
MESVAHVATERPARYLKQLCQHMGRKIQADFTEDHGKMVFPYGECELDARDGELVLRASAPDEDSLAKVEAVVGHHHLERFGERDGLVVTWQRV